MNEPVKRTVVGRRSDLITTSAVRNTANAVVGAVGFVLSAVQLTRDITPVSQRFFGITLNRNSRLTVISVYSPTDSDENAEFHEEVHRAVNTTPARNILLVFGDFNAHLS